MDLNKVKKTMGSRQEGKRRVAKDVNDYPGFGSDSIFSENNSISRCGLATHPLDLLSVWRSFLKDGTSNDTGPGAGGS